MGGAAVADTQTALEKGSRGLTELDDQANRVVEKRVIVVRGNFSRFFATSRRLAIFFWRLEKFLLILRLTLRLPEFNDRFDFPFGYVRSMQPMNTGRTGRQVEHVAAPEKRFGAVGIQNGARIDFCRDPERDSSRKVSFYQPRDHVDRRPLRRNT